MLVLLGMLNAFSLFKHLIIQTENLYHLQHAFVVVVSQLNTCAFSLFKHLIIQTKNLYHLQHAFEVVISQLNTCALSASSFVAPYLNKFFAVVQIMNFFGDVWDI